MTNFPQEFATGKLRTLKKFMSETHIKDLKGTMPSRSSQVKAILEHAHHEHYTCAKHTNLQTQHLQFQKPKKKFSRFEKNWRDKYTDALLTIFPSWVGTRLMDLCRNNGAYDREKAEGTAEPENVFEKDDTAFFDDSEFYCPEAVYWIMLVSSYSGRGHERTEITEAIAKSFKKDEF